MNRLTTKFHGYKAIEFNQYAENGYSKFTLLQEQMGDKRFITGDAIDLLSAYEDTGLTPDEILALKAENERLQSELDRLTEKGNEALTLDKLKPGDYVWYRNGKEEAEPVQIYAIDYNPYNFGIIFIQLWNEGTTHKRIENLGVTYNFYRDKPEGGEG